MAFWVFMLVCDLLTPVLMMCFGWWMWKHPQNEINSVNGYRTARSMKNSETWKFAQEYCGRIWWKTGLALLVPSVCALIFFFQADRTLISNVGVTVMFVQIGILLLSIVPTEIALRNTFDKEGNRKV